MLWLMLLMSQAFASESWLCTTESSQVRGENIMACGVGIGEDEDEARGKAFKSAHDEYTRICQASTECQGRSVTVEPKRTTCDSENGVYKCYRLIVFTIGSEQAVAVKARKEAKSKDYTLNDYWRDWNNKYLRPKSQ